MDPVLPGAVAGQMGYDPDSESIAIQTVWAELERLGFDVDDRQTAGLGYDLLARKRTGEQRLVEVKGLAGPLGPVWLEQNEWAQAQQRVRTTGCTWLPIARHHQWSLCARRILPRRSAARAASSGSRSASTTFAGWPGKDQE